MQVALEWRRCLGFSQRRRGCAEHRRPAGIDGQGDRFSGLRDSAAKQRVRCFAWTCCCYDAGPFLDRVGFAGQRGFAGGEGCALENQRVGWNDVAGPDAQNVARHDLIHVDFTKRAAAFDLGFERHRAAQRLGSLDGVAFLDGVEPNREREDRDDDRAADCIAGRYRNNARSQKDQ